MQLETGRLQIVSSELPGLLLRQSTVCLIGLGGRAANRLSAGWGYSLYLLVELTMCVDIPGLAMECRVQ